jgi:hypothetical protein
VYDKSTRICSIDQSYFGKVVVIEGIYKSDLMYYSFIEDQHCADANVIRVGPAQDKDPSVDAFFSRTRSICGQTFCMDDLHVAAEGRIVPGKAGHLGLGEGHPVIQLTRVLFVEKARKL